MTSKIPRRGDDGLIRLDCPRCRRLLFRFSTGLSGGPLEIVCTGCKHKDEVYFNGSEIPGWK